MRTDSGLVLWVADFDGNSFEQSIASETSHSRVKNGNGPASPSKAIVSLATIGLSGLGNLKLDTRDYLDNPLWTPLSSIVNITLFRVGDEITNTDSGLYTDWNPQHLLLLKNDR